MSAESPARFPRFVWPVAFLVLAALIAFAFFSYRQMKTDVAKEAAASMAKYAPAPDFAFYSQDGKKVTTADLKGKVWVANFIFTRCTGPCPIMTGRMAELNGQLGASLQGVELVSISVDPEYDTPAILKEYGDRVGATPERWKFLTGPTEEIQAVIKKGFLQPLSKDAAGSPMHSTRFVLVDRDGWIRGFQDGNDPDVATKLAADVKTLLKE